MAFHKTLAHRFLHMAKTCSSHFKPAMTRNLAPLSDSVLHKDAIPPDRFGMLNGSGFIDRILDLNGSRIRLDCLVPPKSEEMENIDRRESSKMSMNEVRKVLKAAQMEMARSRLRKIQKESISFSEFMNICEQVSTLDRGLEVAKALDDSGTVIILNNYVHLHPEKEVMEEDQKAKAIFLSLVMTQVAKALELIIHPTVAPQEENNCQKKELQELEEKKAIIDKEAIAHVKKELWCGLGFMVVQTLGLMRLTFWELSWDVMEPICFYLTSTYFLAGDSFFLRTSKEPSFESFFQSRFDVKQKKLMKAYNFNLSRFNELKKECSSSFASPASIGSACNCGLELCTK